jgi:hypothetical protein
MSYNKGKNWKKKQLKKQSKLEKSLSRTNLSIDVPKTVIPPIGDDNWKNENEWYNEMNLYHITSIENSKKIEESGVLMGNNKTNKFHDLSERGLVYTTLNFNKNVWDTIKYHQLFETSKDVEDSVYWRKTEKKYVVYKINGSSLLKRGLQIVKDLNDGVVTGNQMGCFKFHLGDDVIPISEIENIGTFITYNNDYDGITIDEGGRFLDDDGVVLSSPNWMYEKIHEMNLPTFEELVRKLKLDGEVIVNEVVNNKKRFNLRIPTEDGKREIKVPVLIT